MSQQTTNRYFDELASGSISRGRALRLMGAAFLGGTLASFPGVGWATKGGRGVAAPTSVRAYSVRILQKKRIV